ncbi:MAG TPA: hypothetical protein PLP19_11495 [bacterium]|nr:hypothetical protein [bacterium]HPN44106.1 hypothetical protein [bacterium]
MKYSDQKIQDFLDNNMPADLYRQFKEELHSDPVLKSRVQVYKQLYSALNDRKGFELDPKFTSRVMKKAQIEELGALHFKLWHIFIAMFIFIACINLSLYYVDTKTLVEDLKFSTPANDNSIPALIKNLNSLLGNIDFNLALPIPVAGIIILIILGLLDRFIFYPRYKAASFYR